MLAIRLQRHGRKKVPVYRVAVQDAHRHPSSGRVVTYIGSYDPHTKKSTIDKEKAEYYLKNGARPTPRVTRVLIEQKIDLPKWVTKHGEKKAVARHPEKLRKNQPKEESQPAAAPAVVEEVAQAPAAEPVVADDAVVEEQPTAETVTDQQTETPSAEATADEKVEEASTAEPTETADPS